MVITFVSQEQSIKFIFNEENFFLQILAKKLFAKKVIVKNNPWNDWKDNFASFLQLNPFATVVFILSFAKTLGKGKKVQGVSGI